MFVVTSLADLLAMPVPAWIFFVALGGLYAIQHITLTRRVHSHARILSHQDRWANSVEMRLDEVGQAMGHAPLARRIPSEPAQRTNKDFRSLSNEQVRALIGRLVGARAA
jgi:hypothetical protein